MFLIGLGAGIVTTLLSAVAWDAASIIAFRLLYGVTGALVVPNGMALMMDAYGPRRRAAAVGWFQFAMTGAPTIGLVVGGPLIEVIGWRWMFVAFAAVTVIALLVGMKLIRPTPRRVQVPIDYLGAATLAGAVLAGLLALTRMTELVRDRSLAAALTDVWVLALLAICAGGVIAFIQVETGAVDPMLKLQYFRRRNFTMPMVSNALSQFAYMGGFVVTPALLGGPYGLSVGAIALLLVPRPGAFSLASPLGGYLPAVMGERKPMVIGSAGMMAAMVAFVAASLMTGTGGLVALMAGLVLTGLSAGIRQPAAAAMVVGAVDDHDMGIANGMNQQIMFIGVVAGIQTMNVFIGEDAAGRQFATTFTIGAVVAGIGLLAALASRDDVAGKTSRQAAAR
jgi:MFS family permease